MQEPQQQQDEHSHYQQQQQQHIKLVPYSVNPIVMTPSRTAATPHQQQGEKEAVTISTPAVDGSSSGNNSTLLHLSISGSRAPTPKTPGRASEIYAAADAARRSMAGNGEGAGTGTSTPSPPAAKGSE